MITVNNFVMLAVSAFLQMGLASHQPSSVEVLRESTALIEAVNRMAEADLVFAAVIKDVGSTSPYVRGGVFAPAERIRFSEPVVLRGAELPVSGEIEVLYLDPPKQLDVQPGQTVLVGVRVLGELYLAVNDRPGPIVDRSLLTPQSPW